MSTRAANNPMSAEKLRQLIAQMQEHHDNLQRKIQEKEALLRNLVVGRFTSTVTSSQTENSQPQPCDLNKLSGVSAMAPCTAPSSQDGRPSEGRHPIFDRFPSFGQFVPSSSTNSAPDVAATATAARAPRLVDEPATPRRLSIHSTSGRTSSENRLSATSHAHASSASLPVALGAVDSVTLPLTGEQRRLGNVVLSATSQGPRDIGAGVVPFVESGTGRPRAGRRVSVVADTAQYQMELPVHATLKAGPAKSNNNISVPRHETTHSGLTDNFSALSPIKETRVSDDHSISYFSTAHQHPYRPHVAPVPIARLPSGDVAATSTLNSSQPSNLKRVRFTSNSPQVAVFSVERPEMSSERNECYTSTQPSSQSLSSTPSGRAAPLHQPQASQTLAVVNDFLASLEDTRHSLEHSFSSTASRLSACSTHSPLVTRASCGTGLQTPSALPRSRSLSSEHNTEAASPESCGSSHLQHHALLSGKGDAQEAGVEADDLVITDAAEPPASLSPAIKSPSLPRTPAMPVRTTEWPNDVATYLPSSHTNTVAASVAGGKRAQPLLNTESQRTATGATRKIEAIKRRVSAATTTATVHAAATPSGLDVLESLADSTAPIYLRRSNRKKAADPRKCATQAYRSARRQFPGSSAPDESTAATGSSMLSLEKSVAVQLPNISTSQVNSSENLSAFPGLTAMVVLKRCIDGNRRRPQPQKATATTLYSDTQSSRGKRRMSTAVKPMKRECQPPAKLPEHGGNIIRYVDDGTARSARILKHFVSALCNGPRHSGFIYPHDFPPNQSPRLRRNTGVAT